MNAILFGSLFFCLFLTVPIGMCLAISTAAVIFTQYPGTEMINMLAQSMVTAIDNYTLMAIPFFMLVGILMEKTGLAKALIDVGEAIAGPMPGGLGAAAIIASMFFAAISGSGPAVVAAIGSIMIPAMSQRNYDADYSGALVASSSTIGPIIPPSIPMIVYGATVGVSVTKLFTAGVFPGLLMGGGLLIINYFISKKRGYKGKPRGSVKETLLMIKDSIFALFMPVIVLGGIYAGIFTPTESAVVGVFYALIVGTVVYRQFTLQKLKEALMEAGLLSATIMVVMGGATTFGRLMSMERIPESLAAFMLGVTDSPMMIMFMINIVLLLAGMFIDTISSIILLAPLFVPIIKTVGFDVTHFGIIMCVNLCIGFLTPPLGVNLFVAQSVAKVPLENIIKQVLPFIAILLVVLVFITVFPAISMFLPNLLGL